MRCCRRSERELGSPWVPRRPHHTMRREMPVSEANSRVVYDALKASGVRVVSALPETWLVHLIRMAEDDPEMILV